LGSHLTEKLIRDGNRVTVIDNLAHGKLENLSEISDNKNFSFIKHDIRKPIKIEGKIDYVCNLACPASPRHYFSIPFETLETSSIGTRNMLLLAQEKKARFFHTSTSEVYGDPKRHPQSEKYFGNVNPYCLRSCYDEGKRYAEALIYIFRHKFEVNTGFIRIFNTYGPKMRPDDGRVVSTFIRQALANEDITIEGTGNQTRSFCFVSDQIRGIIKMIHSEEEGPINIGNPHEFTIRELAEKVIKLTNSKSKITKLPPALSDPKQRRPNIRLARKKLKWEPKIELDEGLLKTIEWFKKS